METGPISLKHGVFQIAAACIAHSIAIQAGINMAFSTIMLPQIMLADQTTDGNTTNANDSVSSDLTVDKDEASWIASLVTVSTPVGSLLTGALMDRFGRKAICAFTTVPFVTSWILITLTTTDVTLIYAARILAGVGGGLSTAAMVYVSEIAHPRLRPMLLSFTSVFVSLGILVTTILGYFLAWRTVAITCGLMAVFSFLLILFLPESPSWLVALRHRGKDEEVNTGLRLAQKSLRWLLRTEEDYQTELQAIMKLKERQDALKLNQLVQQSNPEKRNSSLLQQPQVWKPISIMLALFFLQQCSGGYVVIFYAVQIFEQIGSVDLDQFTCVMILGLVRFLMAILSVFLSKSIGRRKLLISSAVGTTLSMFSAAACVFLLGPGVAPSLLVLLSVFFSSYGVLVIPWTLIGEILPLRVRGKGSGILIAAAYLLMFVTVKLFIFVLDRIGIVFVFGIFGGFSLLLAVFVYFVIPETLGRTLEQIEKYF